MLSVLNFFIEQPKQSFTLAQVVRSLKHNRATCYSIMNGLVEAGYLYRNADKTYVLGPAILTIARKAQAAFSPLDIARQEMRQLADSLDVVVSVQFLEDQEVVSHERAASVRHLTLAYAPDSRYPLHPWGVIFLSPLRESEIDEAFDKARPPLAPADREAERRMIAFAREHGYVFAVYDENDAKRQSIRSAYKGIGEFATELVADESYSLQFLKAPIFNQEGQVAFAFALSGFSGRYQGNKIAEIGREVVEACKRVTTFITGA